MAEIVNLNLQDSTTNAILDLRNISYIENLKIGTECVESDGDSSVSISTTFNSPELTQCMIYGNVEVGEKSSVVDDILDTYGAYVIDPVNKKYAMLDPTDHSKFVDGTDWDGTYGDAFRRFPKTYFKVETLESGKQALYLSTAPINEKYWDENWIGVYKGTVIDNKLHSRPNVQATGSQDMTNFWNYAQNLGKDFGLVDYFQHCFLNALHLVKYGNADSTKTMGKGLQDAGGGQDSDGHYYYQPISGYTASLGNGTGEVQYKSTSFYMNKLFGIEGLAGAQWEFRPNIRFTGSTAIVYKGNQVSNTIGSGNKDYVRTFPRNISSGYVTKMVIGEDFDFLAKELNGSASTYYCDYYYGNSSGELLIVGGYSADGSRCGLSSADSDVGFGLAGGIIGCRLAFKGDISTYEFVSGSELKSLNS